MRTTIEIRNDQRAELMRLAAERGEKGFSRIVQQALEQYLAGHAARRDRVAAALGCFGSLSEREAGGLREAARAARESWR